MKILGRFLNVCAFFLFFVSFFAAPEVEHCWNYNSENVSLLIPSILQLIGFLFLIPNLIFTWKDKKAWNIAKLTLISIGICFAFYFIIAHTQIASTTDYLKWIQHDKNHYIYPKMIEIRTIFFIDLVFVYLFETIFKKAMQKKLYFLALILPTCMLLFLIFSYTIPHMHCLTYLFSRTQSTNISTYQYSYENYISSSQLENIHLFKQSLDHFTTVTTLECILSEIYILLFPIAWISLLFIESFHVFSCLKPNKQSKLKA